MPDLFSAFCKKRVGATSVAHYEGRQACPYVFMAERRIGPMELTHFDEEGRSRMVDVSNKKKTKREAVARCSVFMKTETLRLIKDRGISKGDVLGVARIAGIQGAKRTSELIPLCHPLNIDSIEIYFYLDEEKSKVDIESKVKIEAKTGAEMEALTAVSISALAIYDMCKAVDKGMMISDIRLMEKRGGKSGEYKRPLSANR